MYTHFLFDTSSYGTDFRISEWVTKEELQEKYSQKQFEKSFNQLSNGQKDLIMDSVNLTQKLQTTEHRHSKATINEFNKCACMDLVAAAIYGYGPFKKGFLNETDSPEIQKKCVEKFLSVRDVLRNLQKEYISKYKTPIKDPSRNPFAKNLSFAYNMNESESKQENDAKELASKIWKILNSDKNGFKTIEVSTEAKKDTIKESPKSTEEIEMVPTVDKNGTTTTYVPAKEVKEEPRLTSVKTEVGVEYNVKPEANIPQPKVVANPEPQPATETLNVKQKKTLKDTPAEYKIPNPIPNDPEAIKRATDVVAAVVAPEAKKEENAYKLSDHIKIKGEEKQQTSVPEVSTAEILALRSQQEKENLKSIPTEAEMTQIPSLRMTQRNNRISDIINNPVLDFVPKELSFKDPQYVESLFPGVCANNGLVQEKYSSFVDVNSIIRSSRMNPQVYQYMNSIVARIFSDPQVLNRIKYLTGNCDSPLFQFVGRSNDSLTFLALFKDPQFPDHDYKVMITYTPGVVNNTTIVGFKWNPMIGAYAKV